MDDQHFKKTCCCGVFFANFLDTPWFNTDSETKCSQKPGEILLSHGGGWPRPYQWCLLVSTIQGSSHIIPTIHPTVSLVMYCLDVLWNDSWIWYNTNKPICSIFWCSLFWRYWYHLTIQLYPLHLPHAMDSGYSNHPGYCRKSRKEIIPVSPL